MASSNDELWSFVAEWYDPVPQVTKQYLLKYFPQQNQAEMFDMKTKRLFLKKSPCPSDVSSSDFFIGSQIILYSRDLKIVDYADISTRSKLSQQLEDSIAIISPNSINSWGKIIDSIVKNGFVLIKMKSIVLNNNIVDKLSGCIHIPNNFNQGNAAASLIIRVQKNNCIRELEDHLSDLSTLLSCQHITTTNSNDVDLVSKVLLDDISIATSATYDNCTCCIIKPHCVKAKQCGEIIDMILVQGYEISAIVSVYFNKTQAEEFLEVYKGVVPEYSDHILQFTSGMSIVLELRAEEVVPTFRQSAGPWDIEMAKALRPQSIRAIYGIDIVKNAIHCTDLDTDGIHECTYCFKVMT